jgi:protein-disulfide isomerase
MRHLGAALTALLTAGAAAVLLIAGGTEAPHVQRASARSVSPSQQIDALLAGVPEAGATLGSPTAPVTLQFFGDLQCPTSRDFALLDVPSLISRWVRGGRLRIEYRSLQTATRQPAVFIAQQAAALAAGAQRRSWYYIELFYHEQSHEGSSYVTSAYLEHLAAQIPGMDVARWRKDREEPSLAARVAADEDSAAHAGFHHTPALLLGRTGARASKVPPFFPRQPAALYAAIERLLPAGARPAALATSASADARARAGKRSFADWSAGAGATPDPAEAPC